MFGFLFRKFRALNLKKYNIEIVNESGVLELFDEMQKINLRICVGFNYVFLRNMLG